MPTLPIPPRPKVAVAKADSKEIPFGVNEVRLNARQWLATFVIVGLILLLTPWLWGRLQRFDTGPDYRIPYQLSKDYWLYGRRLNRVAQPGKIVVLGDSVVWLYQFLLESRFRALLARGPVRVAFAVCMVLYLCVCSSGGGAFIYFQF